ncbi:MAG: hypothetical protein AAGG81_04885, partial [Chlamydiota bacterium]
VKSTGQAFSSHFQKYDSSRKNPDCVTMPVCLEFLSEKENRVIASIKYAVTTSAESSKNVTQQQSINQGKDPLGRPGFP